MTIWVVVHKPNSGSIIKERFGQKQAAFDRLKELRSSQGYHSWMYPEYEDGDGHLDYLV